VEAKKPSRIGKFAGWIATKLCGTDKDDQRADKESEGLMMTQQNPQPIMDIKRRETDEDKKRLMEMKEERQQEIKNSSSVLLTPNQSSSQQKNL
jgi:riboflavin synthase